MSLAPGCKLSDVIASTFRGHAPPFFPRIAAAGILDCVKRSSAMARAVLSNSQHRAVRFCGSGVVDRIRSVSAISFLSMASRFRFDAMLSKIQAMAEKQTLDVSRNTRLRHNRRFRFNIGLGFASGMAFHDGFSSHTKLKSSQFGFASRISFNFFSRSQPLISFSRAMASVTSENSS